MLVLNFAHPLTHEQLRQVEELAGQEIERVIEVNTQIDPQEPLAPQVTEITDAVGLTPMEWQSKPLIINPPSLNFIAVAMIAELHGRCGYFPACLRLRPVAGALPPRYEVAEILNLQAIRDRARQKRT